MHVRRAGQSAGVSSHSCALGDQSSVKVSYHAARLQIVACIFNGTYLQEQASGYLPISDTKLPILISVLKYFQSI